MLEIAEVYEGVGAPLLNDKEQSQAGEEQEVHGDVVAEGVWRGE